MATKTATKDIIERFDDFFKTYRIEQLDNGRLRLVIDSTKAALFVDEKISEGLSAEDAVEWLLDFFIVKPNTSAGNIAQKKGLKMLIGVVEDVAPDSKQSAVQERGAMLSSDPEPAKPKGNTPDHATLDEASDDEDEVFAEPAEIEGLDDEPKPPVATPKKKAKGKKSKK